jgi:hypothetical protein
MVGYFIFLASSYVAERDSLRQFCRSDLQCCNLKLTRKNWLALNYFGNPPELDGELEAEMPMDELMDDRVIDINSRKPLEESPAVAATASALTPATA